MELLSRQSFSPRNDMEYNVTGTNIRAGTEIKVTTERPTVSLSLTELDKEDPAR